MSDEAGWITYDGQGCPVDPEVKVDVRGRSEPLGCDNVPAKSLHWHHTGSGFDIVAYKLTEVAA